jgi:hypothetical protein
MRYRWTLHEADWDAIPVLRRRLPKLSGRSTEHVGMFLVDVATLSVAAFVDLMPPKEAHWALSGGVPRRVKCSTCGRSTNHLPLTDEPLVLNGPLNDRGVFRPSDFGCLLMHEEVLHDLRAAGLDTGIHATPVHWDTGSEFVWVRGTQPLGHALHPFGSKHPPCAECGWCKPRYNFYPTFDIGDKTGWMWSEWGGPVDPIVSGDVYRFLRDHPSLAGDELSGYIMGDISEIDQAFLPAEYRRPEHAIPWSQDNS